MSSATYWCDVCGVAFPWHAGAAWFGSFEEMERLGRVAILVVCSSRCKREVERRGVPHPVDQSTVTEFADMKAEFQRARPTGVRPRPLRKEKERE